jgi:hypothetical protein
VSTFIDAHRDRFGVEPICRELEVSASAYRARRTRPPSNRALRDAWLLALIRRVHEASNGVYGQFKVWDELNDTGIAVARCTVERLMRAHGIVGVGPAKTKKTTIPGPAPAPAADLVRRNFSASRPDELWLADFTYIRTWEGWAYLAIVLDVYTRRIVGSAAGAAHAPEPRDRCLRDGPPRPPGTRGRPHRPQRVLSASCQAVMGSFGGRCLSNRVEDASSAHRSECCSSCFMRTSFGRGSEGRLAERRRALSLRGLEICP